jgi:hypothetical protein
VIYTRRVWFIHVECDFHTQNVISIRSVRFLHAECNFQTQCDFDTYKCDYDPYNYDFITVCVWKSHKRVISTRRVWCWLVWVWLWHSRKWLRHLYVFKNHTMRVEITLLCDVHTHECNFWTQSVISTRTNVIYIRRVWFFKTECNFQTQCDFNTHKYDYDTHNCDFHTQSVISTRKVWFLHAECHFYTQSVISTCSMMLKCTNLIKLRV